MQDMHDMQDAINVLLIKCEAIGITPTVDRWITPLEVTDKLVQVEWLHA